MKILKEALIYDNGKFKDNINNYINKCKNNIPSI